MTKMLIDRQVVEHALHVAMVAEHPVKLIAALRAALAEPPVDDPHRDHWVAIAEAAQRIADSKECGPAEAASFCAAIERLGSALAEPDTCTWQQDGDNTSGAYGTSCGRYFHLEDGTPEDNKMAWCCYCGKKLAQSLITEDEDE